MDDTQLKERLLNSLNQISTSIKSIAFKLDQLYTDWKNPVMSLTEENEPRWRQEEEHQARKSNLELQNKELKTLVITSKITLIGILVSAGLGAIDIVLRVFFSK